MAGRSENGRSAYIFIMADNKTEFNKISDKLKADISKAIATHKGVLEFKLTNGRIFQVPTLAGGFVNKTVYKATYSFPERDTIIDNGEMVEIAVIDSTDDKGNPVYGLLRIDAEQEGHFMLNATNPRERRWIEFLLASNYCSFNTNRIEGKEVCELVDHLANSRSNLARFTKKQSAMVVALNMTEKERADFAAAMNWNEREHADIIAEKVLHLADAQPDFFADFVEGNGIESRSILKRAITKGVVSFDPQANTLSWANGEVFAVLETEANKNFLDMFAKWVIAHPKGVEMFNLIKKQLDGSKGGKKGLD